MSLIDTTLALVALLFAALALYDRRMRLIDPARTPDELFREKLANDLTRIITPLTGFQQDLDGLTEAVNQLSATDRDLRQSITELRNTLAIITANPACSSCPLRLTAGDDTDSPVGDDAGRFPPPSLSA